MKNLVIDKLASTQSLNCFFCGVLIEHGSLYISFENKNVTSHSHLKCFVPQENTSKQVAGLEELSENDQQIAMSFIDNWDRIIARNKLSKSMTFCDL